MNTQELEQTYVQYKYVKTRIGSQNGYKVYYEGVLIGRVIEDWKKSWGGVCWSIIRKGDQEVTFNTRRDASCYLRQAVSVENCIN